MYKRNFSSNKETVKEDKWVALPCIIFMSQKFHTKSIPTWLPSALCVVLTFVFASLGWLAYYDNIVNKYIVFVAGIGIVLLLCLGDLGRLSNLSSLLLLGHAAFTLLTIFWAISGKFFLGRYAVTFTAFFFFLYVVLRGRGDFRFARNTIGICAGIATIYSFLNIEAVSTGKISLIADKLLGEGTVLMTIGGRRLYGIFGNANIEASFCAIGILFCIVLICSASKAWERAFWMFALVCNAYVMALGISIFAICCLCVAGVVCLAFSGVKRGEFLTRMIIGCTCVIMGVLCEITPLSELFLAKNIRVLYLWFVMLTTALIAALLELVLGQRMSKVLNAHSRGTFITTVVFLTIFAILLIVALNLTEPMTFSVSERSISRDLILEQGEHAIQLDADDDVDISIYSATSQQVLASERSCLFHGSAAEARNAVFIVPEGSCVCTITLSGIPGETVRFARIGNKQVKLHYRIIPVFITKRFQTPLANGSFVQRRVYVQDGLKLFRLSPLAGLGNGAFESAVSMVQDYEYETNHSHNQYIETLLEGGVIGFTLFVGALVTMGIALWKSRKKMQEGELAWLYPALCAEFVMSTLQMFWDVSMSVTVFACMIYTLYGLIVSTCAEPLVLKKVTEQELTTEKKSKASVKKQSDVGIRIACSILPLFFIVSVGLNIHAQKLIREPVETLDEFMSNLSRAAKMDLYEHNDTKLSYVRAQMENDEEGIYYAQANEYAQQLSKVQSNSIPYILTVYYLNTQQYELAIEEAKRGAKWSASDSDMWNNCADALKQMFIDTGAYSPLLEEGNGNLIWGLEEYREMLLQRDANSLKPISLNESSAVFFDKVGELFDCRNDRDAMAAVLAGATGE